MKLFNKLIRKEMKLDQDALLVLILQIDEFLIGQLHYFVLYLEFWILIRH
jgi:hypothetical protein